MSVFGVRAPFQVLVIPFRPAEGGGLEYAALRRSDLGCWQFVAGGGEDGESTAEAARREAWEEAGIPAEADLFRLMSVARIPREEFPGGRHWPEEIREVPEYAFGIDAGRVPLVLSAEHTEVRWGTFEEIHDLVRWESNRAALRELRGCLAGGG